MHWVVPENLHQERGGDGLIAALRRAGVPHSQHKAIPFIGEIDPDICARPPAASW
jgi:hypothetical protein